jgi:hypothetical protein
LSAELNCISSRTQERARNPLLRLFHRLEILSGVQF